MVMVVDKQAVLAQQGGLCHLCSAAIGPDTPADVLIFWEKDPLTRDYDPVPIIFCRAHTTERCWSSSMRTTRRPANRSRQRSPIRSSSRSAWEPLPRRPEAGDENEVFCDTELKYFVL